MNDTQLRMMRLGAQGYYCSQILIILALEMRGEENPGLVRSMAGLAYGCGNSRGTCGALTGGACLLALYAGRGGDDEEESELLLSMTQELSDWFFEEMGARHGGASCEAIVGEAGPAASRQACGLLMSDTFDRAMEILAANGFDPAG